MLPDKNAIKASFASRCVHSSRRAEWPELSVASWSVEEGSGAHVIKPQENSSGGVLVYCLEGQGCVNVGGRLSSLRPGRLWAGLQLGSSPIVIQATRRMGWSLLVVRYYLYCFRHVAELTTQPCTGLCSLYEAALQPYCVWGDLGTSCLDRIRGLTARADADFTNPHWLHHQSYRLFEPLSAATAHWSEAWRHASWPGKPANDANAVDIMAWIHAVMKLRCRYADGFSEELALAAGVTKGHLIRRFRQVTGLAPMHLLQTLVMKRAATMIQSQKWAVHEVAEVLGYQDAPQFSRAFKKVIGLSPVRYRADYAGVALPR